MEESGREGDSPGPPWAPSESSALRPFAAAVGERAEASPSGPGNGDSARSSNLRAVRKRPFVARLTTDIVQTFEKCNPEFKFSESLIPKRFLTNPAVPVHNDGLDNANSDLILYVDLALVNKKSSRRYIVQDMLGQGTFGQVVKCWDSETNNYVAVKVVKNQPAFYQQAIMEVSLLRLLNEKFDPDDQHHIVRMLDFFLYQNHLCIAFEMLGSNLYELLKKNSLRGLQMKYVQTFSRQILDALITMKDAGIIHCDLKPENILIASTVKTVPGVKVIDFGSACMEVISIYSYFQSRYYRSPEVLLGYPYTTAIDMWSFGCIVAELYIGQPLFPGASEYDVLCRMIEIIGGQPPDDLLREAENTGKFFKHVGSIYPSSETRNGGSSAYRILSEDEIKARDSKKPKVGRWYFPRGRLDRLIYTYPWKNLSEENLPEKADCLALVDFLRGLVEFDPNKRWSPLQASYHPFITGEAFTGPYEPVQETPRIPVGIAAVVDHNPEGGHLLSAGLSPQVGSINRCQCLNNALQPNMPFSFGSSCASFGSHSSFNDNAGISYGSYDVNSVNIYNSPMDPSGFNLRSQLGGSFLGSSPDIQRRLHLSHGGGIRLSPGGLGHMSLGTSPQQFTAPNLRSQGNSTYLHNALPNSSHYSWRSERGFGSGLPFYPSSSHGSFIPTNYNGFLLHSDVSADTLPSTADWDPNYRNDEINTGLEVLDRIIKGSEEPTNLKLLVLQHITNRFSDERRIGYGGCGVVYKGILPGGTTIAVKRISDLHAIDDKMFRREVESMMLVKHQNIVRFLGYCSQTEEQAGRVSGSFIMAEIRERLLCVEYVSNGSLDHHVSDELRGLEWHTRFQIIKGICEGLHHLHKHIIHMDLKPANILLDDHMTPKITDFGLSRHLDDKSQTMDANRLLTWGYCAPEYLDHGKMSAKSDIYSLGVIIFELVTGTKYPNFTKVHRRWRHRWNKSAKDTQQGHIQVAKCLGWAQKCTNMNPTCRPNVWDIISDLNKIDGSDVDISDNATECLDMLGIEPLEINLPCELDKPISCSIELTNGTDDYFAFMISTTSLCSYSIHKERGTLPPKSKCSVTIILLKTPKALLHHHYRDEFTVQSTRVDGSLAAMDIDGDMFNEVPDKVVDEVNFMVVHY